MKIEALSLHYWRHVMRLQLEELRWVRLGAALCSVYVHHSRSSLQQRPLPGRDMRLVVGLGQTHLIWPGTRARAVHRSRWPSVVCFLCRKCQVAVEDEDSVWIHNAAQPIVCQYFWVLLLAPHQRFIFAEANKCVCCSVQCMAQRRHQTILLFIVLTIHRTKFRGQACQNLKL